MGSRSAKKPQQPHFHHDTCATPACAIQPPPPSASAIKWTNRQTIYTLPPQQKQPLNGPESILPTPTRPRFTGSHGGGHVTFQPPAPQPTSDAPPPASLYDFEMAATPSRRMYDENNNTNESVQFQALGGYHSMSDSNSSKNNDDAQSNVVTVFGYPIGATSSVINHFRGLGQVNGYEEGRGNWVNIEFSSSWAASRAISRNGTVMPGTNCMIGVIPLATAQSAIGQGSLNSFLSPVKKTTTTAAAALHDSDSFKRPTIRSVTGNAIGSNAAIMGTPMKGRTSITTHHSALRSDPHIYATTAALNSGLSSSLSWSQKLFRFIFGW